MSINLISRHLSKLKLVLPRVVGCSSSSTTATNNNVQRCFFSSMQNNMMQSNNNDDDGGPVSSSNLNFAKLSNKNLADMSTIPGWNLVHNPPRRNPRGALVGTVVSDKMQKTINVAIDRYKIIPKYRKRIRFTRKFMAHDEHEVCNVGDLVMIVPCQKISRHKHFMVREIIRPKGQL